MFHFFLFFHHSASKYQCITLVSSEHEKCLSTQTLGKSQYFPAHFPMWLGLFFHSFSLVHLTPEQFILNMSDKVMPIQNRNTKMQPIILIVRAIINVFYKWKMSFMIEPFLIWNFKNGKFCELYKWAVRISITNISWKIHRKYRISMIIIMQ